MVGEWLRGDPGVMVEDPVRNQVWGGEAEVKTLGEVGEGVRWMKSFDIIWAVVCFTCGQRG